MSSTTARADTLIPEAHPFKQHLHRVAAVDATHTHRRWTPADGPMPSIYLSHGAPPLFEDAGWMTELRDWARALPKPKAILIVSAHWESAPLALSASRPADLVYDFGGFSQIYFRMRYDTPDGSDLARQVAALLPQKVHQHTSRGLDHGAWVPLKVMYPAADIPVLQLSIPTHDAGALMGIGARLKALREQGVLVIGSGYMTHGLPFITPDMIHHNAVPGWSSDFDAWAADALARGDVDELAAFRDRAPGLAYAHPTVEHFTPLFITLGAAADPTAAVTTTIDGYSFGLAKRSFQTV
jgi:4,5-DOPA dioxygenase extradiol